MCTLYVSNCNQEQVKYLRMFVMPHLEQTDVNMTNHGVQNERNFRTVQLMMSSVIIDIHLINQIQYLLMNNTICDKQRHTGTARKRFYVHANTGCKRYLINQIQYLLINDTIRDKQRYTGTARKRFYVHVNKGCQRNKLHDVIHCYYKQKLLTDFVVSHSKRTERNKHQYVVRMCRNAARLTQRNCYNYNQFLLTLVISETILGQQGNVTAPTSTNSERHQKNYRIRLTSM
ncbi:ribonucleo protein [Trichinella spiralis]|uniref:ribonucleo protein n=1 Tax=Trichinella spiralis TaxID=6334 RepID=UPI0001EFC7E0|nr:ribonucleo protein [Trichinella spiralis]